MILLQRLRDLFNLDIPIGRLRYFLTVVIIFVLIGPLMLFLTPNILLIESDETLASLIFSGHFEIAETIIYLLISGLIGYGVQFFLDAKRLLDIFEDKQTSLIIASLLLVLGFWVEFFVPLNGSLISTNYLVFVLGMFTFLCVKEGKNASANESEESETEVLDDLES